MRTEDEMISDLQTIVSKYILNFSTTVVSRTSATVSSFNTEIAIFFQDGKITQELLRDLIEYQSQNDRNEISISTKKEIGNLDFEVIIINAEIFYI